MRLSERCELRAREVLLRGSRADCELHQHALMRLSWLLTVAGDNERGLGRHFGGFVDEHPHVVGVGTEIEDLRQLRCWDRREARGLRCDELPEQEEGGEPQYRSQGEHCGGLKDAESHSGNGLYADVGGNARVHLTSSVPGKTFMYRHDTRGKGGEWRVLWVWGI